MSEIEKLDKGADVTRMSKEALWYDDPVLHYRYHKVKAEGGNGWWMSGAGPAEPFP